MKIKTVKIIDVNDWDELVKFTYKRPYNFQQQNGCREKGLFDIIIPDDDGDSEQYDSIPEEVYGNKMGVKFDTWLAKDPKIHNFKYDFENILFWNRNFYPDINTVANDLYKNGILEAGKYTIKIDW